MAPTAYDRVRYPGRFYAQSSADRLATIGRLFGLATAAPDRCRMLELGCGDGGNLIPQALAFPDSHFVGVDLAAAAVEAGRRTIEALGLRNVELHVADIAGFDPGDQPFDYVSAHGVLSWVPEPVREALLASCGRVLAPQGVAYVSYSALPGGHVRNVPRDLMRFHARGIDEPQQRIRAAREAIDWVLAAAPGKPFVRALFEREMAGFEGKDYFLLHDLLADENEPLYFLDFVDAARGHGLQFLAEADFGAMSTAAYPAPLRERLDAMPRLEREQYLDFIELNRFRQTLLCRRECAVDPPAGRARLEGLWFSSPARPAHPGAPAGSPEALEFRHPYAGAFRAETPLARAVASTLAQADPRGLDYASLDAAVAQALGGPPERPREGPPEGLPAALLLLYGRGLLSIHATRWRFAVEPGPRPQVSPYVRLLAAAGAPVVTANHGSFALPTPQLRRLVMLLDGSRDVAELLEALVAGSPPEEQDAWSLPGLERRLQLLCQNALLLD